MAYFLQQLVNAIPISALYAVLAFGYAVAFAVTKRADVTYGAIFAFAGHTCLLFADFGWNQLWLILPATLAIGGVAGVGGGLWAGATIGRGIMMPLAKRSPNAIMVAAIGVTIALMEAARLSADTRALWLPPLLNTRLQFWQSGDFIVTMTLMQLVNTTIFIAMVVAGWSYLRYSAFGRKWTAVSDDPLASALCGVNAERIFLLSYCTAAMFASIAGVLATFYYGNMDFGAGLTFGLKVVLISAAGGYSSPLISACGAAFIGLAETMWGGYGPLAWRDAAVLMMLVVVLVIMRSEKGG